MKIASLAKARILRLFLEVILKISSLRVEPARSLERETYVLQKSQVLSLDGTESEKLVPDRSLLYIRSVFCSFPGLHLQVSVER